MDEKSKCDLPYGHFGRADYLLEESKWDFGRIPDTPQPIIPLGEQELVHQNAREDGVPSSHKEIHSVRHAKEIRTLVEQHPEIQPAAGILPPLVRVSETMQKEGWRHEPFRGSLMSFAEIRSEIRHEPTRIAAYSTCDYDSTLRLMLMQMQRWGWEGDRSSWLEIPALRGEEITWTGSLSSIRQVLFSHPIGHSIILLAARTRSETFIFRPTHGKATDESSSGSNLASNCIYSIGSEETNENVHVDIAFNPWFPEQFGIIDEAGYLSMIELKFRGMKQAERVRILTVLAKDLETTSALDDNWARLAWIFNVETVVVCTRKSLTLFGIAAETLIVIENVNLDLSGSLPWVLDFVVLPGLLNCFAVATSTHVIIYRVAEEKSSIRVELSAKIRHFKNPEDLTLKLEAFTEDEYHVLLLYSGATNAASTYRVKLSEPHRAFWEVPTDFSMPSILQLPQKSTAVMDLHVLPVKTGSKRSVHTRDSDMPSDHLRNIRFYSLITLYNGGYITQGLYYRPSANQQSLNSKLLDPPRLHATKHMTSSKIPRENFIVADGESEFDEIGLRRVPPIARRTRRPHIDNSSGKRIVNLELVASYLQSASLPLENIEEIAVKIKFVLASKVLEAIQPLRTLQSFSESEVSISDVQQASAILEEHCVSQAAEGNGETENDGTLEHNSRFKVASVPIPAAVDMSAQLSGISLASAYEQIVAQYVSPLPPQISGRVRLAKHELAVKAALDLALASRVVRIEESKDLPGPTTLPSQVESHLLSQGQKWVLPMRPSGRELKIPPSSPPVAQDAWQRQPSLPTPSPTGTPSVVTSSSSHPSGHAAPQLYRLSKYTTFSKPTLSVLPRSLTKVLSHWTVGTDPSDYDWLSTSRNLAHKDEEVGSEGISPRQQAKMQKRAEKHLRRQRKEAAAIAAQQLASSQAPAIFSASQPSAPHRPAGGLVAASSQSGPPVASQVVPGRFGGRPAKKKRRKQGF